MVGDLAALYPRKKDRASRRNYSDLCLSESRGVVREAAFLLGEVNVWLCHLRPR